MKLVYRKRVRDEVRDAYVWYENERLGLGEEFLTNLEVLVAGIVETPHTFARVDSKVRRGTLTRFPYNVFYQVESKRIVVLAVVHHARNPNLWPVRTNRAR